ncbi:MAG: glycosyltransferase family 4 protein [Polyangiaceae bacterium]|nr:glycosyltransferase family 4 protein [Polyangiaceae bacterium]
MVFEPDYAGHHFAYLRLILSAFADMGASVVLATSAKAVVSTPYSLFIAPIADRVQIDSWVPPSRSSLVSASLHRVYLLAQAIRRARPDHLVVPYADGLSQVLGAVRPLNIIPRSVPSEGLMFRGGYAYPSGSHRRRAFTLASWELAARAPWTRVHQLDPFVLDVIRQRGGRFASRCSLMPDPVEPAAPIESNVARGRLGIPEDGRYVGCVGALDRRKGVDLLIHAFAKAQLSARDRLLLVGPHEPYVADLLRCPYRELVRSGRIISIDRFVSQEEFESAVASVDVVCTPYPAHIGSASIVIRAAAARKFVLGSDFGWIGAMIRRFALGRACRVTDPLEFARALTESLAEAQDFALGEAARRFVKFHSPENFAACWTAYSRDRIGKPHAPGRVDWEWVSEALDAPSVSS